MCYQNVFRRWKKILLSGLCSVAAATSWQALALTIDEFEGDQEISSTAGETVQGAISLPSAVGGARFCSVTHTGGLPALKVRVTSREGTLSHSQDSSVTGSSTLIWDGAENDEVSPRSVNGAGLGGVDFTQDGGTALLLKVITYDEAFAQPISLVFTVYDASDPTGGKFSSVTYPFTSYVNGPTTVEIPFISFTTTGGNGAAEFTRVGAVSMTVQGDIPATDLTLDSLSTNGKCSLIPDNQGKVIDVCGVCAGDGKSCLDCAGVPFGTSKVDQCNVCGGDGTSCLDCKGVVFGTSKLDRCGVCDGDGMSCLECKETDIKGTLAALDGGAAQQDKFVRTLLQRLLKSQKDRKTRSFAAAAKKKANKLHMANWSLAWQVPAVNKTCQNTQFCVSVSNVSKIGQYRKNAADLRDLALKCVDKLNKINALKNGGSLHVARAQELYDMNMKIADQVPASQSACS